MTSSTRLLTLLTYAWLQSSVFPATRISRFTQRFLINKFEPSSSLELVLVANVITNSGSIGPCIYRCDVSNKTRVSTGSIRYQITRNSLGGECLVRCETDPSPVGTKYELYTSLSGTTATQLSGSVIMDSFLIYNGTNAVRCSNASPVRLVGMSVNTNGSLAMNVRRREIGMGIGGGISSSADEMGIFTYMAGPEICRR